MTGTKKDWLLHASIGVVCLLLMLPRILSAQFGLLDDAVLLLNAQQSLGDFSLILYQFQDAGRFLPTALFLRTFVFSFAGFEPQRWYIWSSFLLIVTCLEMAYITRRYNFSRLQIFLSVIFFVVSPALIENFYTLSKSEIPLLLLISSAILLATTYASSNNRFTKIIIVVLCFLFLLFSLGAKETAIVLPFLFMAWLAISWFHFRKTGEYRDFMQSDSILLVGSLVGCILYWLFRSMLGIGDVNSYSGAYQLFNLEKIFFNLKVLLGWLIRDYPYLLPLLLALFFFGSLRQTKTTFFVLRWLSWMGALALILLPWNYLSYYLLPFSFGSAVFSGMILGQMLTLALPKVPSNAKSDFEKQSFSLKAVNGNWLIVPCVASLILMIPPAFNATAYATEQLVFDRANWQILEQVRNLPPKSQLLLNVPQEVEYFYEFQLFVSQIYNRPDIKIEPYQSMASLPSGQNVYIASPVFLDQVLPRVRALNGPDVIAWERSLKATVKDSRLIYSTRLSRPVVDVGLHRMLSFLKIGDMIGYSDRTVFTGTNMVYGWDLWKYSPPK